MYKLENNSVRDFSKISELLKIGHTEFGENKLQEAILKWKDYINKYPKINLHDICRQMNISSD